MQQKIAANRLSLQHAFSATTMRIILLNIGGKTRKSYIITRFVSYACPMDAEVWWKMQLCMKYAEPLEQTRSCFEDNVLITQLFAKVNQGGIYISDFVKTKV